MAATKRLGLAVAFALWVPGVAATAAAEKLDVTLDKAALVRVDRAANVVMIGNPDIADVSVETPELILVLGRTVGETSLLALDADGQEIVDVDIVVVPEAARHVTIHRGTAAVLTLSCDPRCAGVENPGTESTGEEGGGEASSGQESATAATDATGGGESGGDGGLGAALDAASGQ